LSAEGRCSSSSSFMRRGRGKPWANVNVLFKRPCQFLAGAEFPLAGDAASPRAIGRAAMDLWRVADVGCCHCRSTCSTTSMRAASFSHKAEALRASVSLAYRIRFPNGTAIQPGMADLLAHHAPENWATPWTSSSSRRSVSTSSMQSSSFG
jgi:hypothetical protein